MPCEGLSLVMVSLQSRASSLRSKHASLRSVGRERLGTAHDQFLIKTNESPTFITIYIYVHIYIYIYICVYVYVAVCRYVRCVFMHVLDAEICTLYMRYLNINAYFKRWHVRAYIR